MYIVKANILVLSIPYKLYFFHCIILIVRSRGRRELGVGDFLTTLNSRLGASGDPPDDDENEFSDYNIHSRSVMLLPVIVSPKRSVFYTEVH